MRVRLFFFVFFEPFAFLTSLVIQKGSIIIRSKTTRSFYDAKGSFRIIAYKSQTHTSFPITADAHTTPSCVRHALMVRNIDASHHNFLYVI